MTDTSWTIGTDPDGDVTAATLRGDTMPTVVRGEAVDPTPVFEFDTAAAYETLLDYVRVANGSTVATPQVLDGSTFYRETQADTESLLMSFDPSGAHFSNLASPPSGWWGVLVGGSDETLPTGTGLALALDVWVLEPDVSTYADRAAAKTAHEK